ncbi:hypothetical protein [Thermococcus sp.]|nr:hypothetical protein [Thermococcus sp.]
MSTLGMVLYYTWLATVLFVSLRFVVMEGLTLLGIVQEEDKNAG